MLAVTPFSMKKETMKTEKNMVAAREEAEEEERREGEGGDGGEQHSDDQKHKDKCNICQSKVSLRTPFIFSLS